MIEDFDRVSVKIFYANSSTASSSDGDSDDNEITLVAKKVLQRE